jgi:hypothetical protein
MRPGVMARHCAGLPPPSQPRPGCRGRAYLNLEMRSAFSRMTLALSAAAVPVGSPLYMTLGFDQKGMRGQPPQLSL